MLKFSIPKRLDATNAADVEAQLTQLLDAETPNQLVCDFSETDYVSSAGLRIMLLATKRQKSKKAECILCAMKKPVRDVFRLAGFEGVLDIRDSVE